MTRAARAPSSTACDLGGGSLTSPRVHDRLVAAREHRSKSKLEAAVCEEMRRQGVAHEHRTLRYRVHMPSGKVARYEPDIVAHRGPVLFLVEACLSYTPGGGNVDRLMRFLEQHSPEIVLAVIAPKRIVNRLPPESYDELYAAGDVPKLVRRIREQDPTGAVLPFPKRR